MKNLIRLIGIAAIVVVIGFSIAACPDGSSGGDGGIFTLTGIPSNYNGKYLLYTGISFPYLVGVQSISVNTGTITAVQISDGSVTLPVWAGNYM